MSKPHERSSVVDLVADIFADMTGLVRKEFDLLKAEIADKASQLGRGAGELAIGGMLVLAALIILLQAAVMALVELGLGPATAGLIVGVIVAVLGAVFLKIGSSNMKATNLKPDRTREQVERDARMVKESVS